MRAVPTTVRYLPYGFGLSSLVIGFAMHGAEVGVLGSFVGYFLGKVFRSTLWTVER